MKMEVDERILEKVRALLSKAERTEYPEEAQAFTAKAQEIMAKHNIVQAMIADAAKSEGKPVCKVIYCEKPYASQKWTLLNRIAISNNGKTVGSGDARTRVRVEVFAFEEDAEAIEILYTSLLVQGTREMLAAKVPEWEHGKTFRVSFWTGFSVKIAERLQQAKKEAEAQVQAEAPVWSSSVALVLADRKNRVAEHVQIVHPRLGSRSVSYGGSANGYNAGQAAGNRAGLGGKAVQGNKGVLSR
jgi:hypothetical protein